MSIIVKPNCTGSIGGGSNKGFPPGDVTHVYYIPGNNFIKIKWQDPDDTIIDGVTLSTWKGTILIRNINHYPTNVKDGVIVIDNTIRNQYKDIYFEDTGLNNDITYYYRFFTYSIEGVYNSSSDNVFKCTTFSLTNISSILANNSWEVISKVSEAGLAPTLWNIGDSKSLGINGFSGKLDMQIADFNHYDKVDGSGKAGIVFASKQTTPYLRYMNGYSTDLENNGTKWETTDFRTYFIKNNVMSNNESYSFIDLPLDLVKEVFINSFFTHSTGTIVTRDKIFIPSVGEVSSEYIQYNDGPTFALFTSDSSRIKRTLQGYSGAYYLRSTYVNDNTSYYMVYENGKITSGSYEYENHHCLCFCI